MTQAQDKAAGRVLLPTYAAPTKYDLHVTPDLKAFVFDGIVNIDMTTTAEAAQHKTITLHAKELLFRSAQFQTAGGEAVVAEEVSIYSCQVCPLDQFQSWSEYHMPISFAGPLTTLLFPQFL